MNISEHVFMIEIKGENGCCYPVLLHDETNLVIVDTGFPLQIDLIIEAVEQCGFSLKDINVIILTHQDIDHIGCVKEIIECSPNVEIMAHEEDAPYIDGRKTPIKLADLDPNLPFYKQFKAGFDNRRIAINKELKDSDFYPICGGIEIIHTPGHTPGHICIYIHSDRVLIAGDALNIDKGKLTGANPHHTKNMEIANESIKRLSNYDIKTVITYHCGVYQGNVHVIDVK